MSFSLPTPQLEWFADLTVTVAPPIEAGIVTGLNSRGRRRIIPITGGTFVGPELKGRVLAGGADFQLIVSDTCADLDARYIIALDDSAHRDQHIFVQNRALRRGSAADMRVWCGVSWSTRKGSIFAVCRHSRSQTMSCAA